MKPPRFNGDIYTWRCRRQAPPPRDELPIEDYEPPARRYDRPERRHFPAPRQYEARPPQLNLADIPNELIPGVLGFAALAIAVALLAGFVEHLNRLRLARDTQSAFDNAAAATAAREKLQAAQAEADQIIEAYRRDAFRKGYDS
jgi:hypothetical protein